MFFPSENLKQKVSKSYLEELYLKKKKKQKTVNGIKVVSGKKATKTNQTKLINLTFIFPLIFLRAVLITVNAIYST